MLLRMFKNGQMQAYTSIKGQQERNWPETVYYVLIGKIFKDIFDLYEVGVID